MNPVKLQLAGCLSLLANHLKSSDLGYKETDEFLTTEDDQPLKAFLEDYRKSEMLISEMEKARATCSIFETSLDSSGAFVKASQKANERLHELGSSMRVAYTGDNRQIAIVSTMPDFFCNPGFSDLLWFHGCVTKVPLTEVEKKYYPYEFWYLGIVDSYQEVVETPSGKLRVCGMLAAFYAPLKPNASVGRHWAR